MGSIGTQLIWPEEKSSKAVYFFFSEAAYLSTMPTVWGWPTLESGSMRAQDTVKEGPASSVKLRIWPIPANFLNETHRTHLNGELELAYGVQGGVPAPFHLGSAQTEKDLD